MTTAHWQTFSPKQSILTGWDYTKKYFWIIIKLWLIYYLPTLVSIAVDEWMKLIPGATEIITNAQTWMQETMFVWVYLAISIIVAIITTLLSLWLWVGLTKSFIMMINDSKPSENDLLVPKVYALRQLWSELLVWVFVLLWIFCFIIPGIYIGIRLSMKNYFIAEGYGTRDSITASWAITKDNFWPLLRTSILSLWVVILGMLAALIGLLRAIPVTMLAQTRIYTQLKKNLPHDIKPIAH